MAVDVGLGVGIGGAVGTVGVGVGAGGVVMGEGLGSSQSLLASIAVMMNWQ